jgi:Fe-S cluster assembly protein SufB
MAEAKQTEQELLEDITNSEYKYGFVSNIESDKAIKGLTEDTVRFISAKKNEPEWLLEWRLEAFKKWQTMPTPKWANLNIPEIDFQDIIYYAAPKKKPQVNSLDEIDPELLATFDKLGISLSKAEMDTFKELGENLLKKKNA